jgi:hypothetical protein
MCINVRGWYVDETLLWGLIKYKKDTKGPKYGDIVTVTRRCYEEGILYYELQEWPKNGEFEADCFVPLSDIDETEMVREFNTEKA